MTNPAKTNNNLQWNYSTQVPRCMCHFTTCHSQVSNLQSCWLNSSIRLGTGARFLVAMCNTEGGKCRCLRVFSVYTLRTENAASDIIAASALLPNTPEAFKVWQGLTLCEAELRLQYNPGEIKTLRGFSFSGALSFGFRERWKINSRWR